MTRHIDMCQYTHIGFHHGPRRFDDQTVHPVTKTRKIHRTPDQTPSIYNEQYHQFREHIWDDEEDHEWFSDRSRDGCQTTTEGDIEGYVRPVKYGRGDTSWRVVWMDWLVVDDRKGRISVIILYRIHAQDGRASQRWEQWVLREFSAIFLTSFQMTWHCPSKRTYVTCWASVCYIMVIESNISFWIITYWARPSSSSRAETNTSHWVSHPTTIYNETDL